ncbi:MAG TPA: anaerobic ribonucleoside-triphosphate reductase [Candidatus Atribacteria bacterium]|nr:anaerobic ribonucleoside-triphosphate reductase [Candidatus Atribacteria bacterium]
MIKTIKKREGQLVDFDKKKITGAIFSAMLTAGEEDKTVSEKIADQVIIKLEKKFENKVPQVEEVQDIVEETLIQEGMVKVAKAYILYRDKRRRIRESLKVRKKIKNHKNMTDLSLLVSTPTSETISPWGRQKIIQALVKEAELPLNVSVKIAKAVENKIVDLNLSEISTSLIRELVDNELFTMGYEQKWRKQKVIGMPTFDLKQLFLSKSKENSNIGTNNPEAINLTIAENTIKQYMLQEVFSKEIADAHLKGWIHIHDLGYPRIYCSGHSLEFLKKYGLELENLDTSSAPARHTRTLTGHLNTFLASMQAYYAGALGIGYLNIMYAPFLVGLTFKEIKQEAQYLIFSGSQNAFSRGGQSLFLDFNVHLGIPNYLVNIPAIGPGGKYTGKTYGEYQKESQLFLRALMEVWKEGDYHGKVFAFPKMDLHIDNQSFEEPEQIRLLKYACEIASENGSPYFIFDREDISLAACCRLKTEITDQEMIKYPEKLRFAGIQNVTINLPQCAYRAFPDNMISGSFHDVKNANVLALFLEKIDQALCLAVRAHLQKKKFLGMMMENPSGPLWQIGKLAQDGKPYVNLDEGTYLIGLIGLNEAVQYITGKQLHENEDVFKLGLKIVSFMSLKCREYSKKYNLKLSLEESPAESAAGRLAKIDLQEFPNSEKVIKGNSNGDESYYTNSIHFAASAPVDLITRIIKQSKFHPLIKSGAIIHAFVGENQPSPESIYNLIKKVWRHTKCSQLTISPEFTICNICSEVSRGLQENCSGCGSGDVYGVTRIVGYYSKITNWNKNKIGELKDRHSGNYNIN